MSRPLRAHFRKSVVLLVEPNSDSREMYREYLATCGLTVMTVVTTDEAFAQATEADVVVTGIRVAGSSDGVGLIRRLRDGDQTKATPIIVLTACALAPDRQRAQSAGCDVFLPKPCLPDQLVSEIRRVLALRRVPRPKATPSPPTTLPR